MDGNPTVNARKEIQAMPTTLSWRTWRCGPAVMLAVTHGKEHVQRAECFFSARTDKDLLFHVHPIGIAIFYARLIFRTVLQLHDRVNFPVVVSF